MNKEVPYWYKLISLWINKGNTGLTVPFILGAHRYIYADKKFNLEEIHELFLDIKDTNITGKIITFQYCDNILQNVLGSFGKLNANYYDGGKGKKFFNKTNNEISLVIASELNLGDTLEEITSTLHSEYKKSMGEKRFSWNKDARNWTCFSPEDNNFIAEAIG